MTRFREFLLDGLSQFLEAGARDVVIGDLAELNLGLPQTVCELCGLIARQQARLWKDWHPWLALLGVAALVGIRLNFTAGALSGVPWINLRTYLAHGVGYHHGLTTSEQVISWLSHAVAVMVWSWTAGFAYTSLARRTAPVTGVLLCFAWLCWNGFWVGRSLLVSQWLFALLWSISLMFFFLPAVWGAKQAFRIGDLAFQQAVFLLLLTVCLIAFETWTSGWPQAGLERWSEGAMHGGIPWYRRLLPFLLLSWPSAWIVVSSSRHRRRILLKLRSGD